MKNILFYCTLFISGLLSGQMAENTLSPVSNNKVDLYRPYYHFTPEENWMNDPNGMFYYKGEYHLYYQHNPFGNTWGHMSWGHAVSNDLIHWEHLPVALAEEDGIMIFSGSAVVDWQNTSGFGSSEEPAIIAIYTGYDSKRNIQHQNIAYSTDQGRTFTKYAGNPVIDLNHKDFRDPKVFWYAPENKWVMAVALSADRKIAFYDSNNLKDWSKTGEFGPYGAIGGVWECPDLFVLKTEEGENRWVLEVDLGDSSVAGGSGGQYFVGDFDGNTFKADSIPQQEKVPYTPSGKMIEDFDGDLSFWKISGDAFGEAPVGNSVNDQQPVKGFLGKGFLNSFHGGDGSTGELVSKPFTLTHPYINLLVGGGSKSGRSEVQLWENDTLLQSATGNNNENLVWNSWSVADLQGREVYLRIIDQSKDGWGHINVDHIIQSDTAAYNLTEDALWVDYGKDFYAAVSWSDVPERDGRRLWLGWMNNWQYAQEIPTRGWRSHMSIPRALSLVKDPQGYRLVQHTVDEFSAYSEKAVIRTNLSLKRANKLLSKVNDQPLVQHLKVELKAKDLQNAPLEFAILNQGQTVFQLDVHATDESWELSVKRKGPGSVSFNSKFPSAQYRSIPNGGRDLDLELVLDQSSVEIFADQGKTVFTNLIFPKSEENKILFKTTNPKAKISKLSVSRMNLQKGM